MTAMKTKDIVKGIDNGLLDLRSRMEHQKRIRVKHKRYGAFITEIDGKPGLSLAVKDNIAVQGIRMTAGSRILEGHTAFYSATAARKLEKEFSIAGKASLDPFGAGSGGDTCDFGRTLNPHDEERVPGGSSSGCAVALAAGMCDFAIGSDTFGSSRAPAAFCGVVGMRPSYGLVSRHGLIPLCMSLDTIAPMARDVWGAAYILSRIAGRDPRDTATHEAQKDYDFHSGLGMYGLEGKKVLIPENLLGMCDPEIAACAEKAADIMKDLGAKIGVKPVSGLELSPPAYYLSMFAEFSSDMQRYGSAMYGFSGPIEDVRGKLLSAELKRRIILGTFITSKGQRARWYGAGLKAVQHIRLLLEREMGKHDFIVMPTMPCLPWKPGALGPVESYSADLLTGPASLANLPAISIPCGRIRGLPVGIQVIGKRFCDADVLGAAYRMEGCM